MKGSMTDVAAAPAALPAPNQSGDLCKSRAAGGPRVRIRFVAGSRHPNNHSAQLLRDQPYRAASSVICLITPKLCFGLPKKPLRRHADVLA